MINSLPQFVPQKVCLSCDGCCRFKEEESRWRPKLAIEEKELFKEQKIGLAQKIFSRDPVDSQGYLKTVSCSGGYHCTFFNLEKNTCRIYNHRPFECQLYPYILSRKEQKAAIFVHLNCPYVQEKIGSDEFKNYVLKLEQCLLDPEALAFLRGNPQLVGDYAEFQNELEFLFFLKI